MTDANQTFIEAMNQLAFMVAWTYPEWAEGLRTEPAVYCFHKPYATQPLSDQTIGPPNCCKFDWEHPIHDAVLVASHQRWVKELVDGHVG